MAQITFSLDTETGKGSCVIDGKQLVSCKEFRFYGYGTGFELSIYEEPVELNGIKYNNYYTAYAGKILKERVASAADPKQNASETKKG